ncbi:MAG TPA: DUF892 family protein [Steroidobacteraceae bacterium]|nr:DUF892 family protein [Steroidobacteraceae bacterium]
MFHAMRRVIQSARPGNLAPGERVLSMLAGVGLTLAALNRGGVLRRAALATAGLALMSRGGTGYCGMKAAVSGRSSLRGGLREQWERTRAQLGAGAGAIDSMQDLYMQELQELASSGTQLHQLLGELPLSASHAQLREKLEAYAQETGTRLQDLEHVLLQNSADPRQHPDQAMQSLIDETRKMTRIASASIRDVALVDSLQRLLHYQIATLGSVAAYADVLGRSEEAARFAAQSHRDKELDAELSELAKRLLNPQAARGQAPHSTEARAH